MLHQCGKSVKTKSQKVLEANSSACRKTSKELFWSSPSWIALKSAVDKLDIDQLKNVLTNEYNQEFHYHSFFVKLDRCVGNCNILNDLSNKVCVPNLKLLVYSTKPNI